MRVAVVADTGCTETYNLGVDARLDAAVQRLKESGAEIVAIVDDPSSVSAEYGIETTCGFGFAPERGSRASNRRRRRLVELENPSEDCGVWAEPGTTAGAASSALAQADAVLLCGGQLDFAKPSLVFSRLAALSVAARHAVPTVMSSQYLSPLLCEATSMPPATSGTLRLVGVSDEGSFDTARQLFGDITVRLQVDDAVTLPEREPHNVRDLDVCLGSGYVAITAGNPGPGQDRDLVRRLANLVDQIDRTTGLPVVFIPVDDGRTTANSELPLHVGLADAVNDPRRVVCCSPLPGRQVNWIVRRATCLVTSSQVPLVFGLAAGVPSLALYSDEISAVTMGSTLARGGLPGWRLPIDALSSQYAAGVLAELWHRRDELAELAGRMAGEWASSLDRHWEEVLESLSYRGQPPVVANLQGVPGRALTPSKDAEPSTGTLNELNELMQVQYGRLDKAEQEWSEAFEHTEEYALDLESGLAERTKELASLRRHLDAVELDRQAAARSAEEKWAQKDELESRLAQSERLRVLAEAHRIRAEDEAVRAVTAARSAHEQIAVLSEINADLRLEMEETTAALNAVFDTKSYRWISPLRRLYGAFTRKRHQT